MNTALMQLAAITTAPFVVGTVVGYSLGSMFRWFGDLELTLTPGSPSRHHVASPGASATATSGISVRRKVTGGQDALCRSGVLRTSAAELSQMEDQMIAIEQPSFGKNAAFSSKGNLRAKAKLPTSEPGEPLSSLSSRVAELTGFGRSLCSSRSGGPPNPANSRERRASSAIFHLRDVGLPVFCCLKLQGPIAATFHEASSIACDQLSCARRAQLDDVVTRIRPASKTSGTQNRS
jgi:hypothetical protein